MAYKLKMKEISERITKESHYEHAQRLAGQNLEMVQKILGDNHPLFLRTKLESVDKVREYVDITEMLLRDTLAGNRVIGIGVDEVDSVMTNLIDFDFGRFGYLNTVLDIIRALQPDGRAPEEKQRMIKEHRDVRVPWLYVYPSELGELGACMDQTFEIIASLYEGKTSIGGEHGEIPLPRLSKEARDELAKVGRLIFNPAGDRYVAKILKRNDELGVILVPMSDMPWIRNGQLIDGFEEWTISQFEHEAKHFGDFRIFNGAPISVALLETRALLKQMDCHAGNERPDLILPILEFLMPYIGILDGNQEFTHVEKFGVDKINRAIAELPSESLELLKSIEQLLVQWKK